MQGRNGSAEVENRIVDTVWKERVGLTERVAFKLPGKSH